MEAQSLSECNICSKKFQRKAHLLRHQQQRMYTPFNFLFSVCSRPFGGAAIQLCVLFQNIQTQVSLNNLPRDVTLLPTLFQQVPSAANPYANERRSDVLRDHFSRCELRGSNAIPNSLERGRKRHACDECSRLKVKCDNDTPCSKCKEFGRVCQRARASSMFLGMRRDYFTHTECADFEIDSSASTQASTSPSPRLPAPQSLTPPSTTPEPSSDRNSIGFLLNCPNNQDFMHEFPKASTVSPKSGIVEYANLSPPRMNIEPWLGGLANGNGHGTLPNYGYGANMDVDSSLSDFLANLEFETFERQRQMQGWQFPAGNVASWSGPTDSFYNCNILEQRAFDIREKLRYAASAQSIPNVLPKEMIDAIELVKADTIASFTKLYFKHWHHHAPMVHEASYNPCTAALPLVLSIMSLGGMYSKIPAEVEKVKYLLDTIESYIYSIPGINDEYDLPGRAYIKRGEDASQDWQQYQLEEFQGAYLMIVLQYWSGNEIARARVRQQRFSRLISIYRCLGLQCVQHTPGFMIKDQHSFRRWIRKESFIRVATLMMMLDNAFAIFNNLAPRLQWAEIDLPFPSDDLYFKVAKYEDLRNHSGFPIPKMKIKDAFLLLFSPVDSAERDLAPLRGGNLTALDMQMLMHALYVHVWTSTFCNPLVQLRITSIPSLVAPFKLALRNWRAVWDEIKNAANEDEWRKLGFQKTAEAYYDAVGKLLGIFERRCGSFPPIESDCEKGMHLRRLLSL
ncbi:C2H2 finger domain (Zms1) protein [Rutstroemia sp. NJR-2017a BVV2]|nr:C2H2 finger domain (Zms1) protein [Rutstroemia sp. NJR-2017a BVV2]